MAAPSAAPPATIHLQSYGSSSDNSLDKTTPSSLTTPPAFTAKDSFLSAFPGETVEPKPHRRRLILPAWLPTLNQLDTALWAAVPLVFHFLTIILLAVAMFSHDTGRAFMSIKETNGTGRLDYYPLDSCVTVPGSTAYTCTSPSTTVHYSKSVVPLLPHLPPLVVLKMPMTESQIPAVFVTTLTLLCASLLLYLPLWTLAYFPYTRLIPTPIVKLYRFFPRTLYQISGGFSFAAFAFASTIGVAFKLYLMAARDDFILYYRYGQYAAGSTKIAWEAHLGDGFDLVWAASTFAGLSVIAVNIALHNGFDERVEWPEQAQRRR
ncbi:hypothetical protein JCM8097_003381 [Rhodosporidiobolus ruineniae]